MAAGSLPSLALVTPSDYHMALRQTRRLPASRLLPGAVLAADVVDDEGRVLVRAGTTLTATALELIQLAGVREVAVVWEPGVAAPARPALDPEVVARVEIAQRERFARCDFGQPAVRQVFEYCVVRAAKREAADRAGDDAHPR